MNQHILNIQTDTNSRKFLLKNEQTICIVRSFSTQNDYLVICASFEPLGASNKVKFGSWKIYATTQSVKNQTRIKPNLKEGANLGNRYVLDNIAFRADGTSYSKEVIGIDNQRKLANSQNTTLGLAQAIGINENWSLCITNSYSVPYNQTVYFEPLPKVKVFIASGIKKDMVLPRQMLQAQVVRNKRRSIVIGKYLEVDLKQVKAIYFNKEMNTFEVGSSK